MPVFYWYKACTLLALKFIWFSGTLNKPTSSAFWKPAGDKQDLVFKTMAENITAEMNTELIRTSFDGPKAHLLFARDKSDRRSRPDRRRFSYTAHVPERRSGHDRRQDRRRRAQSAG
jgi:hypothetical protein